MYGIMIVYDASSQLAIRFLSKQVNSSALLLSNRLPAARMLLQLQECSLRRDAAYYYRYRYRYRAMLPASYTCHN